MRLFARDKFSHFVEGMIRSDDSVTANKAVTTMGYTLPDTMRTRIAFHIDDVTFRHLVASSEVIGVKEHSKWNWEAIYDIISGPLLNPKRFDELVRNKFLGRIILYLRPSSNQFALAPFKESKSKTRRTVFFFFQTLLSTVDGFNFLNESHIVADIGECLGQLVDPVNHTSF